MLQTDTCDSTLYPGQERRTFVVKYSSDGTQEDLEEEEVRPLLVVQDMPEGERADVVAGLIPAFQYLEKRLTGECDAHYSCESMYKVCSLPTPSFQLQLMPLVCCVNRFAPWFKRLIPLQRVSISLLLYGG